MKLHKKWNCTILAFAIATVLGAADIHAECVSCQDVVDGVLELACPEFAASPPTSETTMRNALVEIFGGILSNRAVCDDGQPNGGSAAACTAYLLNLVDFSQTAPQPEPEVRVREEIHSLTVEERTLFTQTYRQAWDAPNSELKQMADDFLTNFSRGLHNNGAFLPWHRGYLLQVENLLRGFNPNVTIPYWDWCV